MRYRVGQGTDNPAELSCEMFNPNDETLYAYSTHPQRFARPISELKIVIEPRGRAFLPHGYWTFHLECGWGKQTGETIGLLPIFGRKNFGMQIPEAAIDEARGKSRHACGAAAR